MSLLQRIFSWLLSIFKPAMDSSGGGLMSTSATASTTVTVTTEKPRKYALLVGVNKYALPNADLQGCVNDVERMWKLITTRYGFDKDDVRMLTDERATQQAVLERLEWLVTQPKKGDVIFFQNSSHGSQIRDRNADELDDSLDELIVTYDHSWDAPLIDDTLATFFRRVPEGVKCIFVCDACHSGSMTRGEIGNPHPIRARFLPPPIDIAARSWGRELPIKHFGEKGINSRSIGDIHVVDQNHVLLSGCRDNQTSADAFIDGRYQGALTASLCAALEEHPEYDWKHIHSAVCASLKVGGYTQIPQLTGSEPLLEDVPFGGIV